MNSVFLLHILTILLHFLIEFISGGDAYITKKLKITVKNICKAIYNCK